MLTDEIKKDFMIAYKSKDKKTADTLKMIKAAIQYLEVEYKTKEMTIKDDDIIKLLRIELKKRHEAYEQYKKAGRMEQANKELDETKIIEKYLPPSLNLDEIKKIVIEVVSSISEENRNFGSIMKSSMAILKGKADGKVIKEIIEEVMNN